MTAKVGFHSETASLDLMMKLQDATHKALQATADFQASNRANTAIKSEYLGEGFDVVTHIEDDQHSIQTKVAWVTPHQFSILSYIHIGLRQEQHYGELVSCHSENGVLTLRDQWQYRVSVHDVAKRIVQPGIHNSESCS